MPRAHRYIQPDCIYHLTHRCHDGQFHLKFVRDRDAYRRLLRTESSEHKIPLLNYCVTSNHVHLLVVAPSKERLGSFMQKTEGIFAQAFNRRKNRHGAFWTDRYHATMVDRGAYLWRCMRYIDLNMVRAGIVAHPDQWKWTGYRELVGSKNRCRLIDLEEVIRWTGHEDRAAFHRHYLADMESVLAGAIPVREPEWTESIAVGSQAFVDRIEGQLKYRSRLEKIPAGPGVWMIKEPTTLYA